MDIEVTAKTQALFLETHPKEIMVKKLILGCYPPIIEGLKVPCLFMNVHGQSTHTHIWYAGTHKMYTP